MTSEAAAVEGSLHAEVVAISLAHTDTASGTSVEGAELPRAPLLAEPALGQEIASTDRVAV
jgi:hypothetical protein